MSICLIIFEEEELMKKIFLSPPMSGRSNEEIKAQIEEMKTDFLLKNPFDKGEEIKFVDNFGYDPFEDPSMTLVSPKYVRTNPLLYLGKAIQRMAFCDGVYFGKGWSKARGCLIEMEICVKYDIPYFINRNDGVQIIL